MLEKAFGLLVGYLLLGVLYIGVDEGGTQAAFGADLVLKLVKGLCEGVLASDNFEYQFGVELVF